MKELSPSESPQASHPHRCAATAPTYGRPARLDVFPPGSESRQGRNPPHPPKQAASKRLAQRPDSGGAAWTQGGRNSGKPSPCQRQATRRGKALCHTRGHQNQRQTCVASCKGAECTVAFRHCKVEREATSKPAQPPSYTRYVQDKQL